MSIDLIASKSTLKKGFFNLQKPEDVADLLELKSYAFLEYTIFVLSDRKKYTRFVIPKRNGGRRIIQEPIPNLKIVQHKLLQVLQEVYAPKPTVHGFVAERSIVTNASRHIKNRYVFNIDLEHFFPSIHFGRVRGMFMAFPYELNNEVATVLAQICCLRTSLPQGSPTSPIISNMLCAKMDSQLRSLAAKHHCHYTRYADDITFSTSRGKFPAALAVVVSEEEERRVQIGNDLHIIIDNNGFRLNKKKTRLQTKNKRQEVTGLTVNKFVNVNRKFIRQIRAMLHAWGKYGYDAAENDYKLKYWRKKPVKPYQQQDPSFRHVVKGKIEFLGMVRGRTDKIFVRFNNQAAKLERDARSDSFLFNFLADSNAEITSLIEDGETEQVEFKVGACLNPHTGTRDRNMSNKVLKEVVAFLNSEHTGTLLIGVENDGNILGIEREFATADSSKPNWDGYELFLSNILNDSINNPIAHTFFSISQYHVEGKVVCAIKTATSNIPIFAKDKFYVRSGTQAKELKGYKMLEYIKNRYKSD